VGASSTHLGNTKAKSGTVLHNLSLRGLHGLAKVVLDRLTATTTSVNQAKSVKSIPFGVGSPWDLTFTSYLGEEKAEDVHALLKIALVNDAEGGSGGELGQIRCETEPWKIFSKKHVGRCPGNQLLLLVDQRRDVAHDFGTNNSVTKTDTESDMEQPPPRVSLGYFLQRRKMSFY